MAIQIRCRNPEGKIEKMEIKLEQPWTAKELMTYLREAKDILEELQKKYEENIDLATKLGYERAMKDVAEKQAYARSWEEECQRKPRYNR